MSELVLDAHFASYDELLEAIDRYQKKNYVLFVIRSSKKSRNPLAADTIKFSSLNYECKKGRIRGTESKGIRPNQSSYKSGCTAGFYVKSVKDEGGFMLHLYKFDGEHNHELSKEEFESYPEIRRKVYAPFVETFARLDNIKASELRSHIVATSKKAVTKRDVYNFRRKFSCKLKDGDALEMELKAVKDEGGSAHCEYDEDQKLTMVAFQTQKMAVQLQKHSDILIIDVSYKTNPQLLQLLSVMVVDSHGHCWPVWHCFILRKTDKVMQSCLKILHKSYENSKTNSILVDKEFSEMNILKTVFPNVKIQICLSNIKKTVKQQVAEFSKKASQKKAIIATFLMQVQAETVEDYNILKERLKCVLGEEEVAYFQEQWWSNPASWAAYCNKSFISLGAKTISHIDSFRQKLKAEVNSSKTLAQAVKYLIDQHVLMYTDSSFKNGRAKATRSYNALATNQESDSTIRNSLVSHSAEQVCQQIQMLESSNYIITHATDDDLYNVTTEDDKDTIYVTTKTKCSCAFNNKMLLPCCHIFAVRKYLKLTLYVPELVAKKHRLHHNTVSLSPSSENISSRIIKTSEVKSSIAKELVDDFEGYLSLLETEEQERKCLFLRNLLKGWKNDKDYLLIEYENSFMDRFRAAVFSAQPAQLIPPPAPLVSPLAKPCINEGSTSPFRCPSPALYMECTPSPSTVSASAAYPLTSEAIYPGSSGETRNLSKHNKRAAPTEHSNDIKHSRLSSCS